VMKSTIGSMGKNVALIESTEALLVRYEELGPRVLLQQYLPVDHDVRAVVIGGRYVDAYKRTRTDGEFRMNRPGNHQEQIALPHEVVALCERAAHAQAIEFAGIDLVEHEGRWYVLEINTSPQFKSFEAKTGKNVAKLLLGYAKEKVAARVRMRAGGDAAGHLA
jgi:ribosomal protein S6--L-glutamate ligase